MTEMVRLDKKVFVNADRDQVAEEGSPEAAFLYGSEGQLVPKKEAEALGITGETVGADANQIKMVVVEEPHHAQGQPVVEGSGRSTKPFEPGRVTEASSTMRTREEPTKAVTAEEAAAETVAEERKQRRAAANKQRSAQESKQASDNPQQQGQ